MIVEKQKNKIIIKENIDFDIKSILECGQIFSFKEINKDCFIVVSQNKVARIIVNNTTTQIQTKDVDYFFNFFDFNTNYTQIKTKILDMDPDFSKFFVREIRILNQDPIQTILSFIVSANNNIKRIKNILEKISVKFGTFLKEYNCYAFPTLKQLSIATEEDFKKLGAGYRSLYLVETIAKLMSQGYEVATLQNLSTPELKSKLLSLKGVGPKVADCILFFGFGRADVFPVDTWVRKAYYKYYSEKKLSDTQISMFFVSKFGNVSGYAQQYLYDFMLNNK